MRILGIDPGFAIVGYGAVECVEGRFSPISYGAITTPAHTLIENRLKEIYDCMTELIKTHRPDCIAIEELFFNTNRRTAVDVCQARGVILLSAVNAGINVDEYTPLQIKQAVVGYGRAEKQQVQYMVKLLLGLDKTPRPDDAADALAAAICHGSCASHKNGGI